VSEKENHLPRNCYQHVPHQQNEKMVFTFFVATTITTTNNNNMNVALPYTTISSTGKPITEESKPSE